jgi:hypothetical protein
MVDGAKYLQVTRTRTGHEQDVNNVSQMAIKKEGGRSFNRGDQSIDRRARYVFPARQLIWRRLVAPFCPPDADLVNDGENDSCHEG